MWSGNIVSNMNKNKSKKLQYEKSSTDRVNASLKKRHAAEKRFRIYGLVAISIGLLAVFLLFFDIVSKGLPAFQATYVRLDINFAQETIDPSGERDPATLSTADYSALWKQAVRDFFRP